MFPKIVQKNVKASFRKFSWTLISIMITKKKYILENIYRQVYRLIKTLEPKNKSKRFQFFLNNSETVLGLLISFHTVLLFASLSNFKPI